VKLFSDANIISSVVNREVEKQIRRRNVGGMNEAEHIKKGEEDVRKHSTAGPKRRKN
jgi:hypothetical protein